MLGFQVVFSACSGWAASSVLSFVGGCTHSGESAFWQQDLPAYFATACPYCIQTRDSCCRCCRCQRKKQEVASNFQIFHFHQSGESPHRIDNPWYHRSFLSIPYRSPTPQDAHLIYLHQNTLCYNEVKDIDIGRTEFFIQMSSCNVQGSFLKATSPLSYNSQSPSQPPLS